MSSKVLCPRSFSRRWRSACGLSICLALGLGCSSSGGDSATGGALGSGGAKATGGTPGGGGAGGKGGAGGATGAGGKDGTGGMGTGGKSGTGGSTGTGGMPGTGGKGGADGSVSTDGSGTGGVVGTGGAGGVDGGAGRDGSAAGGAGTGGSGAGGSTGGGIDASSGAPVPSAGCGKTPALKKSGSSSFTPNSLSVAGTSRQFVIRWPDNYDNAHAYRLHLTLHGYGGSYSETAGSYFGLWSLSNNTTIFIALSAISSDWRTGDNLAYVDAVLKAVEDDLCIDTSRITLEGFSQGAAMSWSLACSRPGVFRAAVGHSGGGVTAPSKCDPIPYFGSMGTQENGFSQTSQSDPFAKWNGCTIETFAKAPAGGHACYDYKGCTAGYPVRWCSFDAGHTASPNDSGKSSSWMPSEVWPFISQF